MGEETVKPVAVPEIDLSTFMRDVAWAALIKFATQRLIAALPFLGWGPMGWVTGAVVGIVGSAVYDAMAEAFTLQMIQFKNEDNQREFDSSAIKLRLIAMAKGVDSEEFKKARMEHVKRLSQFVRFG